MNLIEKIRLIERVDGLIRRKATGNPSQLAGRLNISERSLYNLINLMKEMEAPVAYCRTMESFYYEYEVDFTVGFIKNHSQIIRHNGGMKNICSGILYLYKDMAYERYSLNSLCEKRN